MPDLYGHLTPQGVLNGSLQTIVYADNYNDLTNKPSINSVELQGNKTAADLGLLTAGDIPVESVNGKQGVVILDGDDIEYEAGTSVNSKITDLEAEIGSGPVVSVNGQQGVVELDGTDINYSLTKTLNQKIDEVAASIPVVSYPVTSVNTKTGDVVLDGNDIDYAEGVTVNDQIGSNTADIGTNAAAIGSLSQLTTTDKSSLVGAVNEVVSAVGAITHPTKIWSGSKYTLNDYIDIPDFDKDTLYMFEFKAFSTAYHTCFISPVGDGYLQFVVWGVITQHCRYRVQINTKSGRLTIVDVTNGGADQALVAIYALKN